MATAKTTRKPAAKAPAKTAPSTKAATKVTPKNAGTETTDQGFRVRLGEVDVREAVADLAYASVGAGEALVTKARELPEQLKERRGEAIEDLRELPSKLRGEVDEQLAEARKELKDYAARGRKIVDEASERPAAQKALEQTETAREQVKEAVASVRKIVEQGQESVADAAERIGLRRSA